ncbi:carbon-nitrogen hydrolase family protein [Thermus sp.]|uniref:carbon-nitrogen hydrolase family protein n=1 Tax=Thermus sp. TaxID=275 RepID=UPI003D0C78E7
MTLVVSQAQLRILPRDPRGNLEKARAFAREAAARQSTLLCFPEMFLTGFSWAWNQAHLGEQEGHLQALKAVARDFRLFLSGSLLYPGEGGKPANAHFLLGPQGEVLARYDKVHLFSLFRVERHVAPGGLRVLAAPPWGKTGLAVCYDVRFPELFRAYALEGAVLFLCPAAFPYPRREPWRVLGRARAIENLCFFVGTNAVGPEEPSGGGVTYFGTSLAAGPQGELLAEGGEEGEALLTSELDLRRVEEARRQIQVFRDRRPEVYGPLHPGREGKGVAHPGEKDFSR